MVFAASSASMKSTETRVETRKTSVGSSGSRSVSAASGEAFFGFAAGEERAGDLERAGDERVGIGLIG